MRVNPDQLLQKVPEKVQEELFDKYKRRMPATPVLNSTPSFQAYRSPKLCTVGKRNANQKKFRRTFISRQFEIGIIGSGNFVGEACLFGSDAQNKASAVANTNMSVLVLSPEDLTKYLHALDIEKLKEHFKPRYLWHKERLANISSTTCAIAAEQKNKSNAMKEGKALKSGKKPDSQGKAPDSKTIALESYERPNSSFLTEQEDDMSSTTPVQQSIESQKKHLASARHLELLRDKKLPPSVSHFICIEV